MISMIRLTGRLCHLQGGLKWQTAVTEHVISSPSWRVSCSFSNAVSRNTVCPSRISNHESKIV